MSNRSHLTAKRVTDRNGFSRTVYVRPEQSTMLRSISIAPSPLQTSFVGTHWEDARNPRLTALVKKYKRTASEREDASFEVVVANKSGTVILGAPEELDATDIYMRGGCMSFAYAASLVSELPVAVFDSKDRSAGDRWQGHIAVELDPGIYLDITGVGDQSAVDSYFGSALKEPVVFGTAAEAQRYINSSFEGDDVAGYIHGSVSELGWLTTTDFVRHALVESGVSFSEDRFDEVEGSYPRR